MREHLLWRGLLIFLLALAPVAAHAGNSTSAGTAAVSALSAHWIAVETPLSGDDNHNGYTLFELGPSASGPFSSAAAGWGLIPGTSEWRTEIFSAGLVPSSTYFARVTYVDPDGVSGPNPQIVGPITTPPASPNAVTVGLATATPHDDEILVSVPIADDDNRNSSGTFEIATSPGGPWTRKCGLPLPFQPKRCRLRSLTPGTDYWVRVAISDADGVSGSNPQILGPVRYNGLPNLALGRTVTADPGWGCCPSPSQLVDGRIQYDDWPYGFAWTGGNGGYGGGPAGFKQATIDFGAPTTFSRAAVWYHDSAGVPLIWKFQHSNDGSIWTDAYSQAGPVCRGATQEPGVSWGFPTCAHEATFPPVTARYFRFTFDDRTLFRNLHGWAVEIEVFNAPVSGDLVVVNTNDSGPGSLRQAILDANADPSTENTIVFNIPVSDPGFDGATFTLQPLSELPAVRRATVIDGTTQTAFTGDSNPFGPEVVLDGSRLPSGSGLRLADDNAVLGLVIHGFDGDGIGASYSWDPDLRPSRNRIEGNYLGTDATGTAAVPNGLGVDIHGYGSPSVQATGNVIRGNLIAGNRYDGISLCDADRTEIRENLIGTDRTGAAPLGNGRYGILLTCAGSPRNQIEGNTVAWSGDTGILDAPDYRYGVAYTADGHQGNRFSRNAIHSNGGLGIDLWPPPFPSGEPPFTPTPNDTCDGDSGGNLLQNYPTITRAETDGLTTVIEGFLNSVPNRTYTVELFANTAADPSGAGEGQTFLTSLTVATDSSCLGNFSVILPTVVPPGSFLTATATDDQDNTSEFSWTEEVVDVSNQPPTAAAGPDRTVSADAACQAMVTLDGTASSDPDGDSLTYTWSGPFGTASGATPSVALPFGVHTITLTVDDGQGGTDSDELVVTVADTTPPSITSVTAAPPLLWPPNHTLRPVSLSVTAADACDPAPLCRLISVSSNEPVNGLGDGDTAPDWAITGDVTAKLRAERSGTGTGRVYTLAVTCTDTSGNTTAGSAKVTVPHSR
jgi:parallel beta-helix repeat protein